MPCRTNNSYIPLRLKLAYLYRCTPNRVAPLDNITLEQLGCNTFFDDTRPLNVITDEKWNGYKEKGF
jgi:hypothetical protein